MLHAAVSLEPSEMLGAFRPDTMRLLLRVPAALPLRQKAAVRIQLTGLPVGATVVGMVVSVHGEGAQHRVELAPDAASLPALRLLLAAARGESIPMLDRGPRYLAQVPVVVSCEGRAIYMTTFCVSEGGCGLRWSGPLPKVGQEVSVRLSGTARGPDIPGTVCWLASSGSSPTAGVRFDAREAPGAWERMFADVARSGAPAT